MAKHLRTILAAFTVVVITAAYVINATAQVQVWNGDLDGSTNANKIVSGAKGQQLPSSGSGALWWDGGAWSFNSSPISPGLAGQALFTNDAGTSTTWAYPHGDIDASSTDPGALTVNAIQGFGVSTSVPSSGNALVYSSGLWRPSNIGTSGITPGSAGTFLVTNGSSATAWSTLDTFDATHGRITAGGGGSDYKTIVGPMAGGETSYGTIYFLPGATAASSTNYAMAGDGTSFIMNAGVGGGIYLNTPTFVIRDTGTNPIYNFTFTSGGATTIQSASTQTGLTIGTNKAGATLALQADAASTVATLSSGVMAMGSNAITFGTNPATVGEIRGPNNTALLAARDSTNTADFQLAYMSTTGDLVLGSGPSFANPVTNVDFNTLGGWTLQWATGGSLFSTAGNLHVGTNAGNSFHTFIAGGAGRDVIDVTATGAAGTGSTTINGSLAYTTRTVTASFTVDTTTTDRIIFADCSTSSITITLPTPTAGRVLTVIDQKNNCNASSGKEVTLARHGTESIDGTAGNVTIATSGARTDIFSDGTNWFTHMGTKAN